MSPDALVAAVTRGCAQRGFDLVAALPVGVYNRAVPAAFRLPDFGREDALTIVIGNHRAMWGRFAAAVAAEPARAGAADPLDAWVIEQIGEVLAPLSARWEVRFQHEAPPRRIAIARLAHLAGLVHLGPAHLAVHPTYGPWVALRAAVVFDVPGPPPPRPAPDPCSGCAGQPCVVALARASAWDEGDWRSWVAIRDACPQGPGHRYGGDQVRYHYAEDPAVLARMSRP